MTAPRSRIQRLADETIVQWCARGKCHYIDQLFQTRPEFQNDVARLYHEGLMDRSSEIPEKWDIAHAVIAINPQFAEAVLELERRKRDPRGEDPNTTRFTRDKSGPTGAARG